ncbi:MAG: Ca2+-dependent phosphoinositide-specific phospholipase C [Candidatus Alcyoniella australis]|nr:Ca2+-dependent phosphoinositide-specific phospholipase C [Candidatus Alcyoniella australis]
MRLRSSLIILLLLPCLAILCISCNDQADDDDDSGADADDDTDDDDTADDDDDAAGDDDDAPYYPNDDVLRLNDLQGLGTHNSYHLEPPVPFHQSHRYSHKPLDEQLEIGVRQFELDLQWGPGEAIKVYHIPVVDQLSTCDTLVDCLDVLKGWSDEHPGHHAIVVFLEPKDDLHVNHIEEHVGDVIDDIYSVWEPERILTPDDVRGDSATLREAIVGNGWPTLGQARNKIIFHAHSHAAFLDNYLAAYPNLEGAPMFMDANEADDIAAIIPMNNSLTQGERITAAVEEGFIVRTMAGNCCDEPAANDYTKFEAALASGAHFISTDFPEPVEEYGDYHLAIPEGNPSRCNPITAPEFCVSADIEDLITN